MPAITERAAPKVNLTLRVLGRRADGYHELESLVAFADDVADLVTLETGLPPSVRAGGRFAPSIAGENLLDVTLRAIAAAVPGVELGAVRLEKNLPIAAGIGGGSSDAAALIRAVQRANPGLSPSAGWTALAVSLGADVPVCLAGRAQVMAGIGEVLAPFDALPPLAVVLVNPLVSVPADKTARVFKTLAAAALPASPASRLTPSAFADSAALLAHMGRTGNDLLRPALDVVPAIGEVLETLRGEPGCALAQLSGGGPTCFGVFDGLSAAQAAARGLQARYPAWWIAASRLV
jgi:4-diphosphocytidyl-2-C-methyl-D-erythritol kinase